MTAIRNSPLPLSVEKAYHQKCIDLKRRLKEVEETNDAARLRVHRVERAIAKMRIERAILLATLQKKQKQIGGYESDKSSSAPQTPREHASRGKRSSHRASSTHDRAMPGPPEGGASYNGDNQQIPGASRQPIRRSVWSQRPVAAAPPPLRPQNPDALTSKLFSPSTLPLIETLPNGTSVMLVAPGRPKSAPWTINELDPRHHWNQYFNDMSLEHQEYEIFEGNYLPFDPYGHPIWLHFDENVGKYIQIGPHEPRYKNPVVDSVRTDGAQYQRRRVVPTTAPRARADYRGVAIEDGGDLGHEYDGKVEPMEEERDGDRRDGSPAGGGAGFTAANR